MARCAVGSFGPMIVTLVVSRVGIRLAVAAVVGPYVFDASIGTGAGGAITALYVSVGSSGSSTGTTGAAIMVPYVNVGSVGTACNALGSAMFVLYVSVGMLGTMAGSVGAAIAVA